MNKSSILILSFSFAWLFALANEPIQPISLDIIHDKTQEVEITDSSQNLIGGATTGADPRIMLAWNGTEAIPATHSILTFEYFAPNGVDFLEVYFGKSVTQPKWSGDLKIQKSPIMKSEGFMPVSINLNPSNSNKWNPSFTAFRLDLGGKSGVPIQIRNPKLRMPNAEDLASEEKKKLALLKLKQTSDFIDHFITSAQPAYFTATLISNKEILLQGKLPAHIKNAKMVALKPHERIDAVLPKLKERPSLLAKNITNPSPGSNAQPFMVRIPILEKDGRNRLCDQFLLVDENTAQPIGAPIWITDTKQAQVRSQPRIKPSNKKGLGGMTPHPDVANDMKVLGLTACTINLTITGLLHPGGERILFNHQGKSWSFHQGVVNKWDKIIKTATDQGVVVSAILLVNKNPGPLLHPNYNSAGLYSMVNLTTEAGADTFRAIVAFLAERYSRDNKEFGWITHWIAFNEVDYAWTWTNMGDAYLPEYLETYHRAMRLIWLEASLYQQSTEVFASLTHHWTEHSDNKTRVYAPKDILDGLALYSKKCGDFPWAVAYHPYPENLLNCKTWNDKTATNDFNTPKITPKNIDVLDRYLHQPHLLYKGSRLRTVVLSEQGYHTPKHYNDEALLNQATALAYTWEKILPLKSIESFHYHRWQDDPNEGGFLPGLRKLPKAGEKAGEIKTPIYNLYKDLETQNHAAAVAPYLSKIPAH